MLCQNGLVEEVHYAVVIAPIGLHLEGPLKMYSQRIMSTKLYINVIGNSVDKREKSGHYATKIRSIIEGWTTYMYKKTL